MADDERTGLGYHPLGIHDIDPRVAEVTHSFVEQAPELPVHVHKILKIVSDFESDAKEISKLASSDPVLASKILKGVNSAYYSPSKKIDDLHLAIVLLGYGEIRKFAIQCGLSQPLRQIYNTRDIWEHSYLVSVCAENIGFSLDKERAGVFLTCGILHDIGKFILSNPLFDAYISRTGALTTRKTKDVSWIEKEDLGYGINHMIIGRLLGEKWGLSEKLCAVMEYHHHPSLCHPDSVPSEHSREIAVVCLADLIVNRIFKTGLPTVPEKRWFDLVGLKYPAEENITQELTNKLEKAKSFLLYID